MYEINVKTQKDLYKILNNLQDQQSECTNEKDFVILGAKINAMQEKIRNLKRVNDI